MTTPRHDHPELETFTVPLPRGLLARLFRRSPLVRSTDRLEALLLVLAIAVSLVTVPIAAAVGTAIHEDRSRVYAEQVQTRRPATATVVGDSHPRTDLGSPTVMVPARWDFAGAERTGDIAAPLAVKVGDQIDIWVDDRGAPVTRPKMSPGDEAVAIAVAIWLAVTLPVAASVAGARYALDRIRYARWQHDFDRLVGPQ
ncbi:hypothetical protein A9X05_25555 [Mycobacterium sp. E3298]|uniref:Rv1733c family protein n=1 Tax=Mycobacterium sp. E3298 TaxID=1856865 RepID=UPI0007FD61D5|nr:hypothetical protein [Mycobacterium sp. E3298]OBG74703.1 hypothetical protein A9X05_25555 [Mycobacterium sp. E3298]